MILNLQKTEKTALDWLGTGAFKLKAEIRLLTFNHHSSQSPARTHADGKRLTLCEGKGLSISVGPGRPGNRWAAVADHAPG